MAERRQPRRQVRSGGASFSSLQPVGLQAPRRTDIGERAQRSNIDASRRTMAMQAQAASDLQSRIDQITNMAFQTAGPQQQTWGTEYGVDNAPTAELIKNAEGDWEYDANGQPLPGDDWSVFGRAARKAALDQMYLELDLQSTKAMSGITTAALDRFGYPTKSPTEVKDELNKVVEDTYKATKGFSPALSAKLYASLRVAGHSSWTAYNNKWLVQQGKKGVAMAESTIIGYKEKAVTAIAAGHPHMISHWYARATVVAAQSGVDVSSMDAEWKTHIQDALVANTTMRAADIGLSDVLDHYNRHTSLERFGEEKGKKGTGSDEQSRQLRNAWKYMDPETKGKFIASMNSAYQTIDKKAATDLAAYNRDEEIRLIVLQTEFGKTLDITDHAVRAQKQDEILRRMGNSVQAMKVRKALMGERSLAADLELDLDRRIATNTLTATDVHALITNGVLQGKHAIKYSKAIAEQTLNSPALKIGINHIANNLKIVPKSLFMASTVDRKVLIKYFEFRDMLTRWHRDGKIGYEGKNYDLKVGEEVNDFNIEGIARTLVASVAYQKDKADIYKSRLQTLENSNAVGYFNQAPPGSDPIEYLRSRLAEKDESLDLSFKGIRYVGHPKIEGAEREAIVDFIAGYRDLKEFVTQSGLRGDDYNIAAAFQKNMKGAK